MDSGGFLKLRKVAVERNKLKVLVGTQISCNETDDDKVTA